MEWDAWPYRQGQRRRREWSCYSMAGIGLGDSCQALGCRGDETSWICAVRSVTETRAHELSSRLPVMRNGARV